MTLSKKELKALEKRLSAMKDEDIDYSDIPELDEAWFKKAKLVMPEPKQAISMRVDKEVLNWFKKQAKKKGFNYQTYIQAILKAYMDDHKGTGK